MNEATARAIAALRDQTAVLIASANGGHSWLMAEPICTLNRLLEGREAWAAEDLNAVDATGAALVGSREYAWDSVPQPIVIHTHHTRNLTQGNGNGNNG